MLINVSWRWGVRLAFMFALGLLASLGTETAAQSVGTTFTLQARLMDGGAPADGSYDVRLRLFTAPTGGAQVGATYALNDWAIVDGLLTTPVNFGSNFAGAARWLDIGIRPGDSLGAFTFLEPRMAMHTVPNAQFAIFADRLDNLNSTDFARAAHTHNGWEITTPPLELTGSLAGRMILAENSGSGLGSYGIEAGNSSADSGAAGIRGYTNSSHLSASGVKGEVLNGAPGQDAAGVRGQISSGAGGAGVYGLHAGEGAGVRGTSKGGIGVLGESDNVIAVQGNSQNATAGQFNTLSPTTTERTLEAYQYGLGSAGYFRVANSTNTAEAVRVLHDGSGTAIKAWQGGGSSLTLVNKPAIVGTSPANPGVGGVSDTSIGIFGASQSNYGVMGLGLGGTGAGVYGRNDVAGGSGVIASSLGAGNGLTASSATGLAGNFSNGAASPNSVIKVENKGTGKGIELNVTNAGNNDYGLSIDHNGTGSGLVLKGSSNANAAAIVTNSGDGDGLSASVQGSGSAIVGTAGALGTGGRAGKFVNVNENNANTALLVQTNSNTASAAAVVATGTASGLYLQTENGAGKPALRIAGGTLVLSRHVGFTSGSVPDDPIIVINTLGLYTISTASPVMVGQTIWVVNEAGGAITIGNVEGGSLNINANRAKQFLNLGGANWVAVE